MSNSQRIKRRQTVNRQFTRNNYRKAFPYLLQDFEGRCAYSMQHIDRIGDTAMHIDHFDPRLKRKYRQPYSNLYLASSQCNIAKGDNWPKRAERRNGVRFLDPCSEMDYGVHIFEDPRTHELIGTTPAGVFQILICDLNARHFVIERAERTVLERILTGPGRIRSSFAAARRAIAELREQYERKIPSIPPPPS